MKQINDSWVSDTAAQRFLCAAEEAGYEAYFVGGCVRNALLDLPVNDLDIATSATPDTVIKLAKRAGLKPIPTGIEHGTVTLVGDGAHLEVTTFRKDVETDGRRAVVAFADTMKDDAQRRDFRINALFADKQGRVFDPTGGGLSDVQAKRLKFVGDADARIQEDYLRIIRLFRFAAQLGFGARGIDPEALAASARHAEGLSHVSIERQTAELMKLLSAADPSEAVVAMAREGVLEHILPDAKIEAFLQYVSDEASISAIARLAALTWSLAKLSLRLSKQDSVKLRKAKALLLDDTPLAELAFREGAELAEIALRVAAAEQGMKPDQSQMEEARFAAQQVFPVKAQDLMPKLQGAALGAALAGLETAWISSGFSLSKEALVARALDEE